MYNNVVWYVKCICRQHDLIFWFLKFLSIPLCLIQYPYPIDSFLLHHVHYCHNTHISLPSPPPPTAHHKHWMSSPQVMNIDLISFCKHTHDGGVKEAIKVGEELNLYLT